MIKRDGSPIAFGCGLITGAIVVAVFMVVFFVKPTYERYMSIDRELSSANNVIRFQRDQIRNKIPAIEGSSRERMPGDMWFVDHSFKDLYIRTDSSINWYGLRKISPQ